MLCSSSLAATAAFLVPGVAPSTAKPGCAFGLFKGSNIYSIRFQCGGGGIILRHVVGGVVLPSTSMEMKVYRLNTEEEISFYTVNVNHVMCPRMILLMCPMPPKRK